MLHLLATTSLLAVLTVEQTKPYPRPDLLAEPAELAKWPKDSVRILDARPKAAYSAGRVPGAVWVDHATWNTAFAKNQDVREWSQRLGNLGITLDTRVIIYDDAQSKDAARIWWILRYWGVRDVRLLNGGWKAYTASGANIDKTAPAETKPVKLDLKAEAVRLATKDDLLKLLKDKPPQIVDARSPREYCGDQHTAQRNGAIPGAVNLEWSDLLDAKTGRFKSADELTKLFQAAGIDPAKPAVTYCQSGGRASVMAFALELMGGAEVRNYYRSWAEWGNDTATPIVKPKN